MEQDAKDAIVVAIRFLLLLFIGVASWTLMSLCPWFDDGNEEALSYQSLNDWVQRTNTTLMLGIIWLY
jgi:hypothetical protein